MVVSYAACTVLGLSGQLCTMLYEVIFPWVLTFAIIFGLLIKTGLFKGQSDDKTARGVSGIISLVIGFFLVAFTPWGSSIGQFFVMASGTTMMFLMVILGIMLVIGLFSPKLLEAGTGWKGPATLIGIVFVAWLLLGGAFGGGTSWFYYGMWNDIVALVIILIVIGLMMWFVTSGGGEGKDEDPKKGKPAQE